MHFSCPGMYPGKFQMHRCCFEIHRADRVVLKYYRELNRTCGQAHKSRCRHTKFSLLFFAAPSFQELAAIEKNQWQLQHCSKPNHQEHHQFWEEKKYVLP